MIKEIKTEKVLYGKNIEIIFRFPSSKGVSKVAKYGPERFNEQLDLFIKLQSGTLSKEERNKALLECGVDFDPNNPDRIKSDVWGANKNIGIGKAILSMPRPTYDSYVTETTRLFSEYLLKLIADYGKQTCFEDKFKVIVYVFDDLKEGWYGSLNSEEFKDFRSYSRKNMVVFAIGGMYWLYRIFLPFHYTKRFDAAPVMKLFTHELVHYSDSINKIFAKEAKYREILEGSGLKNKEYLSDIFSPLYWEMLEDGRAEFCERPYQDRIVFRGIGSLREFKEMIRQVAQMKNFEEAYAFYDKRIDSATVKYYWARMMAYTIALFIASDKTVTNSKFNLQNSFTFYFQNGKSVIIKDLKHEFKKYWSGSIPFFMKSVDSRIFEETKKILSGISTYLDFVTIYEKSCDYFGIPDGDRILSMKFIREMHSLNEKSLRTENDAFLKQIEKSFE